MHYVARSGTARFGVGVTAINIDVPLIDNGLVDGSRDFSIVINGEGFWIRIEDNEIRSTVDPLFVPDVASSGYSSPLAMTDGRVLITDLSGRLRTLQSNGWMDSGFSSALGGQLHPLRPVQVLGDGKILAVEVYPDVPAQRLVRLLSNGALDTVFTISKFTGLAESQPDGKILVLTATTNNLLVLRRLNADGSPDASFTPVDSIGQFALQNDGKILTVGSALLRVNSDGSRDPTFSPPPFGDPINYFLLRGNGKMIVGYGSNVAQLNEDGSVDGSFTLDGNQDGGRTLPILEQANGGLLASPSFTGSFGHGTAIGWDKNGTLNANFAPDILGGDVVCHGYQAEFVKSGDQVFVRGTALQAVDGFPRHGLARLLKNPPERDFRVFTPAEFFRSSGVARVRVVRTGATTNVASVSFTTRDDTAKAGEDYVPQSGTLNFAPFEVNKEVTVPLLARTGVDARLFFKLELKNPTAGYATIAGTPIIILADLRIATDSLRPRADGSISITLRGTVPGRVYGLESSTDVKNWKWITATQATASTVVFDNLPSRHSPQFYRARTD